MSLPATLARWAATLATVSLTGCFTYSAQPLVKGPDLPAATITWVRPAGPGQVAALCAERGAGSFLEPSLGCALWDGENRCTIIAPEPEQVDDRRAWAVVGHELGHCFFHRYHPEPGRPLPVEASNS